MALIEITVDQPSLISIGDDEQRHTAETAEPADSGAESDTGPETAGSADDGIGSALKTVSTLLTAVTTIAGVLKRLRSEDEEPIEGGADAEGTGEAEAESFVESVVGDEVDADEEDVEELGVQGEDEGDEDSRRGLGVTVAFVLVVALIALALWSRGGDEENVDDRD